MQTRISRPGAVLSFLTLLLALSFPSGAQSQKVSPHELWKKDLSLLEAELPKRHKNLFFKLSKKEWAKNCLRLRKALGPETSVADWTAGLMRLLASVGDGHTGLFWQQVGLAALPIRLYAFSDGLFVILHEKNRPELSRAKLRSIDGHHVDELWKRVRPLISADNESAIRGQAPRILITPGLLHAVGVAERPDRVKLGIVTKDGKETELELPAVPLRKQRSINWVDPKDCVPPVLLPRKQTFSYSYHIDDAAMFIAYNSCKNPRLFTKFVAKVFDKSKGLLIDRVIIDLRHNGGGNSLVIQPLFTALRRQKALRKKDAILVLIGRRTFSSAVLNASALRRNFGAVLFGEPSGGKPNHYGEVKTLKLPECRLTVSYSTKYFRMVKDDPDAILPDVKVPLEAMPAFEGEDPCLQAALRYHAPNKSKGAHK